VQCGVRGWQLHCGSCAVLMCQGPSHIALTSLHQHYSCTSSASLSLHATVLSCATLQYTPRSRKFAVILGSAWYRRHCLHSDCCWPVAVSVRAAAHGHWPGSSSSSSRSSVDVPQAQRIWQLHLVHAVCWWQTAYKWIAQRAAAAGSL
jgi:hypothetical protein